MKEIVYRIQDSDGRGPWKPGFSRQWVEDRPDHDNLPPWYVEFGPIHRRALYGEEIGSGCRTLDQLRRWFTRSEYRKLIHFGYKAVKMEVGRILAESDIQCVFGRALPLKDEAIIIDLYPSNQKIHPTKKSG